MERSSAFTLFVLLPAGTGRIANTKRSHTGSRSTHHLAAIGLAPADSANRGSPGSSHRRGSGPNTAAANKARTAAVGPARLAGRRGRPTSLHPPPIQHTGTARATRRGGAGGGQRVLPAAPLARSARAH